MSRRAASTWVAMSANWKETPLEGGNRFVELLALLGVGDGGVQGPLGNAQSLGGNADTTAVQGFHGDLEALALLAKEVLRRMAQFSNTSSMVGEERIPIFFSFLPKENPGVPFSTMKALIPRCFSALLSLRARTT